jgi:hypothetical protein
VLLAQSLRQDQADQLSELRRLAHVSFGGALDDRGRIRPGGDKRARDHVEDEAHPETTAPLETANGTAAELERAGRVACEKRDPGGPDEVEGALIAERRAELAAFAQAGAGFAGVGAGDGQAHGEQAGRDEGRGADLAGQRECLVRQRDCPWRVIDEHVIGRGDGELEGGVGEVAAGPRETSGLFGEARGIAKRAGSVGEV